MKYGEIRDASLKLLNQYSLAGETIPETYNNQSDYIKRIPQLVDDAMWLIASGPRRLRTARVLDPDRSRDQDGMNRFMLPDDLMDIIPGGLFIVDHGEHHYDTSYARLDERRILLPHYTHGSVWLEYYRRPESVQEGVPTGGTLPADDYELDNSYETHRCIPYYVAAHLVMQDDAFLYASLYNEWQSMLGNLVEAPQPHRGIIEDAYGDPLNHFASW